MLRRFYPHLEVRGIKSGGHKALPYVFILLLAIFGGSVWLGCSTLSLGRIEPRDSRVEHDLFGGPEVRGTLEFDEITEASGIVASRKNKDVLWTHNDSGDGPNLYALNTRGEHLGVYTIAGAKARDWEDIALGPGPEHDRDYLYIGDIGDNNSQYELKYVYRVPEPVVDAAQSPVDSTIKDAATITLSYPFGNADAETLLVDPLTRDLLVVTKRSTTVLVYRAAYPHSVATVIEMEPVTQVELARVPSQIPGIQGAVAGDISPSGLELLIKTYDRVHYWQRESGAVSFFDDPPNVVPYQREPQGEAICWAEDGSGYFTLSEERRWIPAILYFYPRLDPPE